MQLYNLDYEKLETTACPVCKNEKNKILHKFDNFKVVRCSKCKLAFLNPRLPEKLIKTFYESDEYFQNYGDNNYDYKNQEVGLRKTFKKLTKIILSENSTGGSFLDIGCAQGYLIDEVKEYFEFRAGLDFSSDALEKANKYANKTWLGEIDKILDDNYKFDVITAINVIEHVYQPVEFLQKVKKIMKKDGILILSTPKFDGFWYKIMQKKWTSFKIPEHIAFYNDENLITLAKNADFKVIKTFSLPYYSSLDLIMLKLGIKISNKFSDELFVIIPDVMASIIIKSN